jgi:hypothetical protein
MTIYVQFALLLLQHDHIFFLFDIVSLLHARTTKLLAPNVINLHAQLIYLHCCMSFRTSTDLQGDALRPFSDSVSLETILLIYSDHSKNLSIIMSKHGKY